MSSAKSSSFNVSVKIHLIAVFSNVVSLYFKILCQVLAANDFGPRITIEQFDYAHHLRGIP